MGKFQEMMQNALKVYGYSEKTQKSYLSCMKQFVKFHMLPPDKLNENDIYAYQVYLVNEKKVKWAVFNITVCAIKFFYNKTLNKDWVIKHVRYQKKDLNYLLY
jgi:hypothetical protein